jgi:hypothetical protein
MGHSETLIWQLYRRNMPSVCALDSLLSGFVHVPCQPCLGSKSVLITIVLRVELRL